MELVANNLNNFKFRNKLLDTFTFTADHLLSNLNSDSVKIMSCLSQIDGVGLSYFQKYLKPLEKKNCIRHLFGVRFQGYIVNIKEHKIIHIDSLHRDQPNNPTNLYSNCKNTV